MKNLTSTTPLEFHSQKEAFAFLKNIIISYQKKHLTLNELIRQANDLFADYVSCLERPNKKLLDLTLAMADIDTDLRINPIWVGYCIQEAFEYAGVATIDKKKYGY